MTLYGALRRGEVVILEVATGMGSSHVVLVRGMSFMPTPFGVEPVLHVNDPMAYFTQPVPFSRIVGLWMRAIVVEPW
jgi:hypothetical protein